MTLDPRHITRLNAQFPVDDHEFIRGFVYIKEFAITTRLDEVDPSWQLKPVACYQRDNQAIVIVELIVHGVSRIGTGMSAILSNDKGEVNEAEKAAATDAMKRAARLFGIGRYILNFPKGLTDQTLPRWLDRPNASTSHTTVPNSSAATSTQENAHNAAKQAENGDSYDVKFISVKVMHKGEKRQYLLTTESGHEVFEFSRDKFKGAGYIGEDDWTEDGLITFDTPIPAKIAKNEKTGYWRVVHVPAIEF